MFNSSASTRLLGLALGLGALSVACTATGAEEKVEGSGGGGIEIVSPTLGQELDGPVEVVIDRGEVDTTGDTVRADEGGAFWVVVDRDCAPVGATLPVEQSGHHRVPDGEDRVTLELSPGSHRLCLHFADAADVVYYETDDVTISVNG